MKLRTKISMTLAVVGFAATAVAGDTKAPAGGAPAKKEAAPEAKKAPEPAKDAKAAEPAKKPEPPKPPQEVADLLKTLGGTWKCAGKMADPSDPSMSKMIDMKMNMSFKADLDKWWIQGTLTSPGKPAFKGVMYATYDPTMKKWYRTMVDNMGGSETEWSDGMKDNKVVWTGDARGMGMGAYKVRVTEEMVGPKETKMTGEMSMDGKKWMTGWEASCKK